MSTDAGNRRRWRRRLLLGGLATWGLGIAGAARALEDFGREPNIIDIGYGIMATPMSVLGETLRRDGVLRAAAAARGLEFRFHRFEKGVDTLEPLLAGQLDASMPTDVVVLEALAKTDLILLGNVRRSFSSVVSGRGISMTAMAGRHIGYAPGTSGHNALLQGLAAVGLSERDVVLTPMGVREMPEALLAGRIAAFAAWEPTPSGFLRKYPGRYAAIYRQISPAYLVARRELSERQPEAARLLVAALHRAVRWLARSRGHLERASQWTLAEMRAYSGGEPDIDAQGIVALTRSDLLDMAGMPLIPARESERTSVLGRTFDFYQKSGRLPAAMAWQRVADSIDTAINRHVLAGADRYRINQFDYGP